jgi:hypothetical protein
MGVSLLCAMELKTVADLPVMERLTAWSELTYRDKLPRLARAGWLKLMLMAMRVECVPGG